MPLVDPKNFHLPDPSKDSSALKRGVVSQNLAAAQHDKAVLRYAGRACPPDMSEVLVEMEIYTAPDGSGYTIHSACPKCRHEIKIESANKRIEVQKDRQGRIVGLHVERFVCPWEMGEDRQEFGIGMCELAVEYAGSQIRDA